VTTPDVARVFRDFPPSPGPALRLTSGRVLPRGYALRDGQSLILFGRTRALPAIARLLSGSGHSPLLLSDHDGQRSAVIQVWINALTPVGFAPYQSMFVVVATQPDGAGRRELRDDGGDFAPCLSLLDGKIGGCDLLTINRSSLYLHRIIDSDPDVVEFGRRYIQADSRLGRVESYPFRGDQHFSVRDEEMQPAIAGKRRLPQDAEQAARHALLRASAQHAGIELATPTAGSLSAYRLIARRADDDGASSTPIRACDWVSASQPLLGHDNSPPALYSGSDLGHQLDELAPVWSPGFVFFPKVEGVIEGLFAESRIHTIRRTCGFTALAQL
jgi:hypothetical protein